MLKTNRAASKRFKITKGGKILRRHAAGRHLLSCKSAKRKRKIAKAGLVSSASLRTITRMLTSG